MTSLGLTAADRRRLRSSVDVDALERFLAALPASARPGVQRAAVLHFSHTVTMEDFRGFLMSTGNEAAAEALGAIPNAPAAVDHPAARPGDVAFHAIPTTSQFFTLEPPESPALRALWDAIEPRRADAG